MKTTFQINGRYISRMAAEQKAGAERLRRMIDEARESYLEDPEEEISFMVSGDTSCRSPYPKMTIMTFSTNWSCACWISRIFLIVVRFHARSTKPMPEEKSVMKNTILWKG